MLDNDRGRYGCAAETHHAFQNLMPQLRTPYQPDPGAAPGRLGPSPMRHPFLPMTNRCYARNPGNATPLRVIRVPQKSTGHPPSPRNSLHSPQRPVTGLTEWLPLRSQPGGPHPVADVSFQIRALRSMSPCTSSTCPQTLGDVARCVPNPMCRFRRKHEPVPAPSLSESVVLPGFISVFRKTSAAGPACG